MFIYVKKRHTKYLVLGLSVQKKPFGFKVPHQGYLLTCSVNLKF